MSIRRSPKGIAGKSGKRSISGQYDVFISHASENKETVARPLAEMLGKQGLRVWMDSSELRLGDSLRAHLDDAISKSRYGVVILSNEYMRKAWTKNELAAFFSLENRNRKAILPVRHQIGHEEVSRFSPMLADRLSVSTEEGLKKVADSIANVVKGNSPAESFWNRKSIVLGISGASCSGKTWLAAKFKQIYPSVVTVFDLDGYYKNIVHIRTLEHRHDNPQSVDFESAIADLVKLKAGQEVSLPIYDFETQSVVRHRSCSPAPIILVEGLFAFANERFRKELDIKIWIEANADRRLERRYWRDTRERGREPDEVFERYTKDVQPGFDKYVRPMQGLADAVFLNDGRNKDVQPLLVEMLVAYLGKFEVND